MSPLQPPARGSTVTVLGGCFGSLNVNYALWGRMNKLCSSEEIDTVIAAHLEDRSIPRARNCTITTMDALWRGVAVPSKVTSHQADCWMRPPYKVFQSENNVVCVVEIAVVVSKQPLPMVDR